MNIRVGSLSDDHNEKGQTVRRVPCGESGLALTFKGYIKEFPLGTFEKWVQFPVMDTIKSVTRKHITVYCCEEEIEFEYEGETYKFPYSLGNDPVLMALDWLEMHEVNVVGINGAYIYYEL